MKAFDMAAASGASTGVLAKEDLRLLADVGYLAALSADQARADAIFSGLRVLAPQSACPHIGMATALIAMRRADDAVRLLRDEALASAPDDDHDIRLFLGLCLIAAGRTDEARRVLEQVAAQAPEGAGARATASDALRSDVFRGMARGPAMLRPAAAPPSGGSARTPA